MTVLSMSQQDLSRVETLMHVVSGRMTVTQAARLMSVSRRHAHRLLTRYLDDGSSGLLSRRRGRPSNRRLDDAIRDQIVALVRTHYHDFGPTLAAEYLAERHDLRISREKLRQMMIEAGIWKDRQARRPRPYQPRYRRNCRGELIQIDGSKHWWFEDRGPQCTLLVYIDDATSELMHLRMVESESTFAYMEATRAYIRHELREHARAENRIRIFRRARGGRHGVQRALCSIQARGMDLAAAMNRRLQCATPRIIGQDMMADAKALTGGGSHDPIRHGHPKSRARRQSESRIQNRSRTSHKRVVRSSHRSQGKRIGHTETLRPKPPPRTSLLIQVPHRQAAEQR